MELQRVLPSKKSSMLGIRNDSRKFSDIHHAAHIRINNWTMELRKIFQGILHLPTTYQTSQTSNAKQATRSQRSRQVCNYFTETKRMQLQGDVPNHLDTYLCSPVYVNFCEPQNFIKQPCHHRGRKINIKHVVVSHLMWRKRRTKCTQFFL